MVNHGISGYSQSLNEPKWNLCTHIHRKNANECLQRKVRSDLGEGKDGRKTKHVSSMKQRNCVL